MTTINMSEFQEKHTVSRLIGSPPGYVGFGQGGVLTEAVRHRPYSVVLLDECEKADLEVMNLFYQVFDKGMLSDGEGRLVDFRNTIVILTSNLASDLIMDAYRDGSPTPEDIAGLIRPTLSRHFKPALLARMTVVPFSPMDASALRAITEMKLNALADRIRLGYKTSVELLPDLVDEVVRRCQESETGARNIEHILRAGLMPVISRALLERMASQTPFQRITLGIADGSWSVTFPA
jgi:type VI secretion system protein VasG